MGHNFSTTYLEETPPWDDYIAQGWRSERCRELDRLGGLNRPAIARGQSFTAKLQFLAEQVKKQGDVMQEMLLPAPAPKEAAKYTGFSLATEKRAYERMVQEQEKAAHLAKLAAAEGAEAAAAAAAAEAAAAAAGGLAKPAPAVAAAVAFERGSTPVPMPKPPATAEGKSRAARRPQVGGIVTVASASISTQGYLIAPWRLRLWQARRRVMIIVLTVLRLRRGKTRRRYGNKLDNLGFMIHRVLADDVGRFVEEQRKYAGVKEELEGAKLALDEMLCRNSSGQLQMGALTEDASWPGPGTGAISRQASVARAPSLPASVVNALGSSPSGGGGAGPRVATSLSVGRLNSRTRASDSGTLGGAPHSAGVSPMRSPHSHTHPHGPFAHGPPSPGGGGGGPASGPQQMLGVAANGPARLSASGLMVRLFGSGTAGADDAGPGPGQGQGGPVSPLSGAASCSPRLSIVSGVSGVLLGTASVGGGPAAAAGGGGGGGRARRTSTPGGLGSPGNKDSPPTSREPSITQPAGPPPITTLTLTSSPSGRRSVTVLPPTPTSVTAQLAGTAAAAVASAGGLSSMAARRFNSRSSPAGANGPTGHSHGHGHGHAHAPSLVTTGAAGPLQARVSVTSAVAAKHGQIMQVQTQIESESNNLKKSSQMLSMYINRANAAWAEAQAWGSVDASAPGELEAFCYSEQYRIYQADLVRRLRQGSVCLQVFAGDDMLTGTEKPRPGSSYGYGSLATPSPPLTPLDSSGGGGAAAANGKHGHANGRSRQLSHFDSAGSGPGGAGSGGGERAGGGGPLLVSGLSGGGAAAAAAATAAPLTSLLTLRRRVQHDLWTADPWDLIDRFRPGIMPQTDRIQGPSLGARILCQLVLAVEQLAGPEAKGVMPVLLHINEEQMEEVVQELWSYRFFGLKRENVILVASPLHSGYRFNHELKVFEKEYGSSVAPLGSGYSLLQLTWGGEAFIVGPEGAPEVLEAPALTLLQERKVEWLVARRARDLALLSRESILDVPTLAYCMALKDRSGTGTGGGMSAPTAAAAGSAGRANILLEVAYADSLVDARALDSFIMTRVGPAGSGTGDSSASASSSSGQLQLQLPLSTRGSGGAAPLLSPATSPHGGGLASVASVGGGGLSTAPSVGGAAAPLPPSPSGGSVRRMSVSGYGYLYGYGGYNVQHHTVPDVSHSVIELRLGELGTPKMIESLNYMRGFRDGQVTVGLGRYMLHLPSLPALLPNASALRPKLCLHEELVRVSLDLGDITAAPKARTLAVHARVNPGVLLTADDLEKVIPLLQAQDHDLAFRDMLVANRSESQSLNFVASQALSSKSGGQVIVVFVVNNRVSASAVDAAGLVARPGRDRLHLVTCVSNHLQRSDAEELLRAFQKRLLKSMVDTHVEVLVRGMWGLLDMMDNYVSAVEAHMVVMGSEHLTSNNFNYVIGSITLSALKRLHVPVMVVTANSRCNLHIGGDWTPPGSLAGGGAAGAGGPRGPNGERLSAPGGAPPPSPGGAAGAGPGPVVPGPGPGRPGTGGALRCLSLVENHARNMLAFLCTRLLDNKRGDRLLLAQVLPSRHLTRQQAASVRRALDNFNLMASGHGFSVNRVLSMEGPLDEVLAEAVGLQHIQVLALPLPQGLKTLPPALVNLLRSCRGVTLVYKEPIGARQQQVPRGAFGHGAAVAAAAAAAAASVSASWPNPSSNGFGPGGIGGVFG
ncbi:hypothetical protein PLESTB_000901400 [Pleodorina starrii]|uniref:Uncharacterized protein n=1 Tax=Pleodorina starrii TaxID=330485 RepID=A0A9W6BMK9_9CHLO|nr:hypothetical protein PLESTM_001562500 [Pleodorina starrii]GLC54743.1 hypothetical protein PLESTB_000901400 [Pleodorina starrii]